MNLLLDNDIIIKRYYGSSSEKLKIEKFIKDQNLFVLKLTFSEFKRTILKDIIVLYNELVDFLKSNKINDESKQISLLSDFLLDYKKNYGLNAKGRFVYYIVLIYQKILENILELSSISPIEIIIDFLKNQIIDYVEIFFNNIKLIEDKINCIHIDIEPTLYEGRFTAISISCKNCEKEKMKFVLKVFRKEINNIINSDISNHLVDNLKYLTNLDNVNNIDGRKHICLNLTDLFLILNSPKDFIILTSNYAHFYEICLLLKKNIGNPLS